MAKPHPVLCVGDSLTVGWHIPPGATRPEVHPYGQCLSRSLPHSPEVVSLGWPGWTSVDLLQGADQRNVMLPSDGSVPRPGLRLAVGEYRPSLVLLMAGTNDLCVQGVDAHVIAVSVWKLHKVCHEKGVPTVAIGVPGWCPRLFGHLNDAHRLKFNEELERLCEGSEVATFVDFPFSYDETSEWWTEDGVHLSPQGSDELGRRIGNTLKSHPAFQIK